MISCVITRILFSPFGFMYAASNADWIIDAVLRNPMRFMYGYQYLKIIALSVTQCLCPPHIPFILHITRLAFNDILLYLYIKSVCIHKRSLSMLSINNHRILIIGWPMRPPQAWLSEYPSVTAERIYQVGEWRGYGISRRCRYRQGGFPRI